MKYTCRGPRLFVRDLREAIEQRIAAQTTALAEADKDRRASLKMQLEKSERDRKEIADRKDDEFIGRAGCGMDLTPLIESIPADGDVYEFECPKCKTTGTCHKMPAPAEAVEG